jgi:hypothetical protein
LGRCCVDPRIGLVVSAGTVAVLDSPEAGERLLELVTGDLVLLDVERLEDGLIQQSPLIIVTAPVERLGVFQQRQTQFDQLCRVGEFVVGLVEASGEVDSLPVDVAEPGLDLGLGQRVIGREVEQVAFLRVQCVQLGGELHAE